MHVHVPLPTSSSDGIPLHMDSHTLQYPDCSNLPLCSLDYDVTFFHHYTITAHSSLFHVLLIPGCGHCVGQHTPTTNLYKLTSPPSLSLSSLTCTGHLVREESSMTVVYPSGLFSLGLMDHVKVRVRTEVSHAHGFSLQLLLLSCATLSPEQSQTQLTVKREVGHPGVGKH